MSRNGTTRRALLAAAALLATGARAGGFTLTAGPDGYNGSTPGPLLRTKAATSLPLTFLNALSQPTDLRLPGLPIPPLAPGEKRDLVFTPQSAGFDLYGPLRAPVDGLYGAVIVDARSPPAVDLDAVAIFDAAPQTFEAAPGARVRLRLANPSGQVLATTRASAPVLIVAIDGQPCEPFAPLDGQFPVCPGARFELMFDLAAPFALTLPDGSALVRIVPRGDPVAKRPPIAALPANPRLPTEIALERARQVKITLGATRLDGATLFKVARGTPVTLSLVNPTATAQTLRLGGHFARILHAFDDGWDPYWRDVLYLRAGRTLHAAFVADSPGRWPLGLTTGRGVGWFEIA